MTHGVTLDTARISRKTNKSAGRNVANGQSSGPVAADLGIRDRRFPQRSPPAVPPESRFTTLPGAKASHRAVAPAIRSAAPRRPSVRPSLFFRHRVSAAPDAPSDNASNAHLGRGRCRAPSRVFACWLSSAQAGSSSLESACSRLGHSTVRALYFDRRTKRQKGAGGRSEYPL